MKEATWNMLGNIWLKVVAVFLFVAVAALVIFGNYYFYRAVIHRVKPDTVYIIHTDTVYRMCVLTASIICEPK